MNMVLRAEAKGIAEFLTADLTDVGVVDPDCDQILPYAYTTAFYAWLCSLLYSHGFGEEWLDRATRALNAELGFRPVWPQYPPSGMSEPEYHWEFKNLALIHALALIGDQLPSALYLRLRTAILNWRNLNIDSANWIAMRAVSYQARYAYFGNARDQWRSRLELALLLAIQTPEGFIPDRPTSYTMQYHAYVLSLLALHHRLTGSQRVRASLLRGIRFVADFIDPDGDFNYFGRGQRQVKGYACLILALSDAATLCGNPEESRRYYSLRTRVFRFLEQYRRPEGCFPLVLNHSPDRWGWYSYNRLGDYLSLCGVWLFLASLVDDKTSEPLPQTTYAKCYPRLGFAVVSKPSWFASIAVGGIDLAEPVGLMHMWPKGPVCLGGPQPGKALGLDYSGNYLGPMIHDRPLLQGRRAKMSTISNTVCLTDSHSGVRVHQTYLFDGGLNLRQQLVPARGQPVVQPLCIAAQVPPDCDWTLNPVGGSISPTGPIARHVTEGHHLTEPIGLTASFAVDDRDAGELHLQVVNMPHSSCQRFRLRALKALWVAWINREIIRTAKQ